MVDDVMTTGEDWQEWSREKKVDYEPCYFCKKREKDIYGEFPLVEIAIYGGTKAFAHQGCINDENNGHKDYS